MLNEFYGEVDKKLSTEYGKELKKQRSIQVEGAFGVIKQDMGFTRFKRRGLKNVKMEFLIVLVLCQEKVPVKMRNMHSYTQLPVHCIDFFL